MSSPVATPSPPAKPSGSVVNPTEDKNLVAELEADIEKTIADGAKAIASPTIGNIIQVVEDVAEDLVDVTAVIAKEKPRLSALWKTCVQLCGCCACCREGAVTDAETKPQAASAVAQTVRR